VKGELGLSRKHTSDRRQEKRGSSLRIRVKKSDANAKVG